MRKTIAILAVACMAVVSAVPVETSRWIFSVASAKTALPDAPPTESSASTKGTPAGAQAAAQSAIQDGAELIIGPLFAQEVAAAAPIARQSNIPMIAFSSDEKVAGGGVYLLSFLAGRDVPRIVSYAASRGKHNFALLIPQSPYGRLAEEAFARSIGRSGGQAVVRATFPPNDANAMLGPVRQISARLHSREPGPPPLDTAMLMMDFVNGVTGTPGFFIGGRRYTGSWDAASLTTVASSPNVSGTCTAMITVSARPSISPLVSSVGAVTRLPLTYVPFVLPMSSMRYELP